MTCILHFTVSGDHYVSKMLVTLINSTLLISKVPQHDSSYSSWNAWTCRHWL